MFVHPTGMKVYGYGVAVKNNVKKVCSSAKDTLKNSRKELSENPTIKVTKALIKDSYKYIGENIKDFFGMFNPFKKV